MGEKLELATAILDSELPCQMTVMGVDYTSETQIGQHEIAISMDDILNLNLFESGPVYVLGAKRKVSMLTCRYDKNLKSKQIRLTKEARNNLRIKSGDIIKIYQPRDSLLCDCGLVVLAEVKDSLNGGALTGTTFEDIIAPYFNERAGIFIQKDGVYKITAGILSLEIKVLKISRTKSEEDLEHGRIIALTGIDNGHEITKTEIEKEQDVIGFDDIGGCRKQLAQIRECVELPLKHPELFRRIGIRPPRGILMHGPPGTGKTQIARAIANEIGAYLLIINGPEIVSKMSGESESNLRKYFEEAANNAPAIIFMDEIDSIAPNREKSSQESEKRIVSQLLTLMDGMNERTNVVVLGATNRPNSIDPALRRFGRFDREIQIGVPDEIGRLEILSIHTKNITLSEDVDLHAIAKETHGFTGSDIASMCSEAAVQQLRERLPYIDLDRDKIPSSVLKNLRVTRENFNYAVQNTDPSSLRETVIETPNVKWSDIGGLEGVKTELRETVMYPVNHPEKFTKFGQNPSKGVLLYGPPGCGKTLLAKAVATECKANFISIKGPELLSKYVGDSESNVRELFNKARGSAPCVLFFDEIDSVGKSRMTASNDGGTTDRMLNQILTEMDGMNQKKNVFVMGATNRPGLLDSALMRPGRLDQLVYIPLPDNASRLSILKAKLSKAPISKDVNLEELARKTEGFSGADLTEICQRAAKFAIRDSIRAEIVRSEKSEGNSEEEEEDPVPELTMKYFNMALENARKSVTQQEIAQFEAFAKSMNINLKLDKTGQNTAHQNNGGDLYD
ncbi:CDC48 [Ecytonucleospora hepatopenaei]|uniref:CDC48 n=1 Tax=Ecytonucleospora hepatopenaei TaxID=646526 RepID=A0A1W0E6P5_9MICR|nr:CDC48 [Ecytonucleospora hepatopenaei]